MRSRSLLAAFVAVLVAMAVTVACGGGGHSVSNNGTAKVSTTLSDPPTCASPSGPYSHVWVTISDVQIHTSSTANANDPGWVDLTPNLPAAPKQVDLLSLGGNGCVLAQLGSNTNIPAGTYQQIRVMLAPNNTNVASNACGNAGANCVVVNGSTSALNLSSETQTGIKIPSGQIAGGAFTVNPGENKSLDIDFDACASIVLQGAGGYRLKPTLHAGEISLQSNAITGQLVDATTKAPISTAKAIVALEQKDANGIDRVIMQVTPDATGAFNLCPVPAGTYDVVAVVITTSNNTMAAYAATITTGVQPGFALGNIPMTAQSGIGSATQQGIISGLVTTANASSAGTATDVTVSALQPITSGTTTVNYTIPLAQQQASSINLTTASGACPSGTDCVQYQLGLPAVQPFIGAYAPTGATYTQVIGATVNYTVDVLAYASGSGGTPTCTPSEVKVSTDSSNVPLAVTAGGTTTAANATLTGCQ